MVWVGFRVVCVDGLGVWVGFLVDLVWLVVFGLFWWFGLLLVGELGVVWVG